jgi:hypothetical protein
VIRTLVRVRPDPADGVAEPRTGDRLQQVIDRIRFECLDRILVVGGHEDDVRMRRAAAIQVLEKLEAVEPGHPDVQEHDIGRQLRHRVDCARSIRRFADHLDIGLASQHQPDAFAREILVINNQGSKHDHLPRRDYSA